MQYWKNFNKEYNLHTDPIKSSLVLYFSGHTNQHIRCSCICLFHAFLNVPFCEVSGSNMNDCMHEKQSKLSLNVLHFFCSGSIRMASRGNLSFLTVKRPPLYRTLVITIGLVFNDKHFLYLMHSLKHSNILAFCCTKTSVVYSVSSV